MDLQRNQAPNQAPASSGQSPQWAVCLIFTEPGFARALSTELYQSTHNLSMIHLQIIKHIKH